MFYSLLKLFLVNSFWFCSQSTFFVHLFHVLSAMIIMIFYSWPYFRVLSIWLWMNASCSFWYAFVISRWSSLLFCQRTFVGFLLFSKELFSMLSHISQFAIDSKGNFDLALGLFGNYLATNSFGAVSIPFLFCYILAVKKDISLILQLLNQKYLSQISNW